VDLSEVTPVPVRNPTLLADKDPYNSLKPTLKPEPTPEPEVQPAENPKIENQLSESQAPATESEPGSEPSNQKPESIGPIRKAIPVQPQDKAPVEIRRAQPVKPLDQESPEETLLKSATPPPSDLNE
jgi:hypothetical protein